MFGHGFADVVFTLPQAVAQGGQLEVHGHVDGRSWGRLDQVCEHVQCNESNLLPLTTIREDTTSFTPTTACIYTRIQMSSLVILESQ